MDDKVSAGDVAESALRTYAERVAEELREEGFTASQSFAVMALALLTNNSNVFEIANSSITDGSNDQKLDACLIDESTGSAFVLQSVLYEDWNREAAEANKAHDLNTALTWLLGVPPENIPERIRAHALELRESMAQGSIKRLEVILCHNAVESANVAEALRGVEVTAQKYLANDIEVYVREIGRNSLQSLLESAEKDILIAESVTLDLPHSFELVGEGWKAIITEISGTDLFDLNGKYPENRLFSRNIRDYLGIHRRKGNVNHGIRQTVASEPRNFWPYNNGITILTHSFRVNDGACVLSGISIINGAQTTGVLAECKRADLEHVRVPCRIIACEDEELIRKIVLFNNTQNEIKAFDHRSNDSLQIRLRDEFAAKHIEYVHRRTGLRRLSPTAIHADTVAQALCAFHGDLQTAIRQRKEIFEQDDKYRSVFDPAITASHIYLVQSLVDAIDECKRLLRDKAHNETASDLEKRRLDVLEFSTTKPFIVAVVGKLADQVLGQPVAALVRWGVRQEAMSEVRMQARAAWKLVLDALLPKIVYAIRADPAKAVRSSEAVSTAAESVAVDIEAFRDNYDSAFDRIRTITEIRR